MSAPQSLADLRRDLALALRCADHHGFSEGICNHFSVAAPGTDGNILINPRGVHWKHMRAEDILVLDAAGNRIEGELEVEPTALFIHAAVHELTGRQCVFHVHMPYATALTLTTQGALDTTLSQNAIRFHGRIAIDRQYNGLALDASEGRRIAETLAGRDILFLGNHGVVVCGDRIDYTYDDLYYLEQACRVEVIARMTGLPLTPVPIDVVERTAKQMEGERMQSSLFFEALGRFV